MEAKRVTRKKTVRKKVARKKPVKKVEQLPTPPQKKVEENFKAFGDKNLPGALMGKRVKIMKKWSGEE